MDGLQGTEWSNVLSLNIINECLYFSPVVANGGQPSSSQGSDSYSSTSSLSSGTPVSSLSGLSQVMFPPLFGSDLVDVCISTEDCSKRIETAMQTDPPEPDATSRSSRVLSTETSRTVGETVLLKDTVIRSGTAKTRTRTFSAGDKETLDSPKTAVLMALSKPRKAIRRSQSHITVSGTVGLVWRDKKTVCQAVNQNELSCTGPSCVWCNSYLSCSAGAQGHNQISDEDLGLFDTHTTLWKLRSE